MVIPLTFRQSFWLLISNVRNRSAPDPSFGSRLGISQKAAVTSTWVGFFAAIATTSASAFLLARPLVDFFWPCFIVALFAIQFFFHGLFAYGAYRFFFRRSRAEA